MPLKFECPKCGRRFTEWGAEKVGFKCPADEWTTHDGEEEAELLRVGGPDTAGSKKPSLKRPAKKVSSMAVTPLLAEEGDSVPEDDLVVDDEDEDEIEDDGKEPDESPLPLQGVAEETSTGLSDDAGVEDKEDDEEDPVKTAVLDDALVDSDSDEEHWDD